MLGPMSQRVGNKLSFVTLRRQRKLGHQDVQNVFIKSMWLRCALFRKEPNYRQDAAGWEIFLPIRIWTSFLLNNYIIVVGQAFCLLFCVTILDGQFN